MPSRRHWIRCAKSASSLSWATASASNSGAGWKACVARSTIRNAGEFNGFLKPKARLFAEPLNFDAGALVLAPGFTPVIDRDVLSAHETACDRHVAPSAVGAKAAISGAPI